MNQGQPQFRIHSIGLALGVLFGGWESAHAQETSALTGLELQTAVVRQLSDVLQREYILDEIGAQMASRITAQLANRAYAGTTDPTEFAQALTNDLREVYLDRHLVVLPPERYQAFSRMVAGDHGPEGHQAGPTAHIVARVMNRDGRTNVGFLKLPMFDGSTAGLAAIDTAMRTLAGVDAMIIDLRSSPGGDADAVKAISSYLFAEPTHLVSSIGRRDDTGQRPLSERWTTPNDLSPRFADIPVYLLINNETFSAAESFAFGLQRTSRAVLVGAATGGGGHMNFPFELAGGFGASISVGRAFDPRTGEGWQSTGVVPAVKVETDHALYTAFAMIADKATQNAALDPRAAAVHATLLEFADAWYLGDRERMRSVLDPAYSAMYIADGAAVMPSDASDLLSRTAQGFGLQTPRERRNRVITVFDVFGDIASARLMLRETVHQMQLRHVNGAWLITNALVSPKPRHRP